MKRLFFAVPTSRLAIWPALVLITASSGSSVAQVQTLPVYVVTRSGATLSQAMALANDLNIPTNMVGWSNGVVSFVDTSNYLAVPMTLVTNDPVVSNLVAQTENLYPAIPITAQAINFSTLSNLTVLPNAAAMSSASNAFALSGLTPQFGTPVVNNTVLTIVYTNDSDAVISNSQPIDTEVDYQFTDLDGLPLVGAGAVAHVSYGPTGNVTQLIYSTRQFTNGPSVQIISAAQASNTAASLYPPNAQINVQLVYLSPALSGNVTTIIPWYSCNATMAFTNPMSGGASNLTLLTELIPATEDTNYVPSVNLSVSAPGAGTQVVASASVSGGTPPYTYLWSGSNPSVSTNTGASIAYTPRIRVANPALSIMASNGTITVMWADTAGFILQSTTNLAMGDWSQVSSPVQTNDDVESVTIPTGLHTQFFRLALASQTVSVTEPVKVIVTDANGVTIQASEIVGAWAYCFVPAPTAPKTICYGCESPLDPGLGTTDRQSWQAAMSHNGGGIQQFCMTGFSAWPGDFIEPAVPGTEETPVWIYGDADLWGLNTANIVLYIGHGSPWGISFDINGTPSTQEISWCPSGGDLVGQLSFLWEPLEQQQNNVAITMPLTGVCQDITPPPNTYNVPNYIGSWQNSGPTSNDNLFWLCLLSCYVLTNNAPSDAYFYPYDTSFVLPGGTAWQRWGPAFGKLHMLTGFTSAANANTGFPGSFANDMLGESGTPMTIVQAWRTAATACGTGPTAEMGPIGAIFYTSTGPVGFSDLGDYYWGKGTVGPTIAPGYLSGWWYLSP